MHWTLRKRILLGYGVVLLMAALVFVWAFANLLRLGDASGSILSENYRSIIAAENMIEALERQDSGVLLFILGFEGEGLQQFDDSRTDFAQWLDRARLNVTIIGEAEIILEIDSTYASYRRTFVELTRENIEEIVPIRTAYHDTLLPAFERVRAACIRLRDVNEGTMEAASEEAARVAVRAMWSTAIVGLLTLGIGLVLSIMFSSRLVRPIDEMRRATGRIAAGDYDVEVPGEATDELGLLAAQFNDMTAKLRAYRDLNLERIITERRKSEAVIQSIDDGLILVGDGVEIEGINPAAARALDVGVHTAVGQPLERLVPHAELVAAVTATVQTGIVPRIEEEKTYVHVDRDGAHAHYQFVITPIAAEDSALRGAIVLLRDVTKLKELDRLKSEFVATASHELRTPLTSIGMSVGLLRERTGATLNARDRELLLAASEDVERLQVLVNDLLDLSKIEAGKIDLELGPVPVSVLIEESLRVVRGPAAAAGIDLELHLSDELPAVQADANKITWVISNLITNALRYTHSGGTIELRASLMGSRVHISVKDNGEGIPYAYQSKIFDKFVQVSGKKSGGGSGLGLAISKEIVRAHAGSIWVESVPGSGATFTFSLPTVQ